MTEKTVKQVLVIAKYNHHEALRVAAGLTLLNDQVHIDVLGALADTPEINEQKDVLDFAEVPHETLTDGIVARLAHDILAADVVYLL
jgi:hypothetical protein